MAKKGNQKMISVREFAARSGANERTVRLLVQQGRFEGTELKESDLGVPYWLIPETALEGFEARGRGRPAKLKPESARKGKVN